MFEFFERESLFFFGGGWSNIGKTVKIIFSQFDKNYSLNFILGVHFFIFFWGGAGKKHVKSILLDKI